MLQWTFWGPTDKFTKSWQSAIEVYFEIRKEFIHHYEEHFVFVRFRLKVKPGGLKGFINQYNWLRQVGEEFEVCQNFIHPEWSFLAHIWADKMCLNNAESAKRFYKKKFSGVPID